MIQPQDISQTFSRVEAAVSAWREKRTARTSDDAPGFNVFEFVRTDELGLSSVLRWMLDPKASHAQGSLFLSLFREEFAIPHEFDASCATARVEVGIGAQRRLDIEIVCRDFGLAIENKPRAAWQPDQVRSYLKRMEKVYGGRHCLILLKGEPGEAPSDQLRPAERRSLISQGHLIDSDYETLRKWVLACAARCSSIRIQSMLNEFSEYLHENFEGGGNMAESNQVALAICSDSLDIENAVRIIAAREAIFSLLTNRLLAAIQTKAAEKGWLATAAIPKGVTLNPGKHPIVIDDGEADLQVVFDINESSRDQPYVGLVWKRRFSLGENERLRKRIWTEAPGDAGALASDWPWYVYLTAEELGTQSLDNAAVWAALHDPQPIADLAIRWAERLFSIISAGPAQVSGET